MYLVCVHFVCVGGCMCKEGVSTMDLIYTHTYIHIHIYIIDIYI
jgi:hypothetical protein